MTKFDTDKFINEDKGSFAINFAILLLTLLLFIGVAIDWSRMVSQRFELQAYADAAVLAAVTSGEEDIPELTSIAEAMVASIPISDPKLELSITKGSKSILKLTLNGSYEPVLVSMFGYSKFNVGVVSEAPLGGDTEINLSLVLDTTQSMQGSRLQTLKTASTDLLDRLQDVSQNPGDVKVSLVPFSDYVRIDPIANAGAHWINIQPDETLTFPVLDAANSINCRQEGTGELASTVCDTEVFQDVTKTQSWKGCMGSRRDDFHKVAAFQGRRMQGPAARITCNGGNNIMSPLLSDLDLVKQRINNLSTIGRTYIPSGLIWGWRTLDPAFPFTQTASDPQGEKRNIMILMTDGSNTVSLGGEKPSFEGIFHWGSGDIAATQQDADDLTRELCNSIKASGIEMITIAFEVTDVDTINLLRNCASSFGNFYDAANSQSLVNAFRDIGTSLSEVRLSR